MILSERDKLRHNEAVMAAHDNGEASRLLSNGWALVGLVPNPDVSDEYVRRIKAHVARQRRESAA